MKRDYVKGRTWKHVCCKKDISGVGRRGKSARDIQVGDISGRKGENGERKRERQNKRNAREECGRSWEHD